MTPWAFLTVMGRQVGPLIVSAHSQRGIDLVDLAAIDRRARPFEGDPNTPAVLVNRGPPGLNIAEEHHADGTPVVDGVREQVAVHENAVRLPEEPMANLAIDVAKSNR